MDKTLGICSGYFNPLHAGHIDYINESKKHCDFLVVIVNSDLQVEIKRSKKFMSEDHRKYIVGNLKSVDFAIISIDTDSTVRNTLSVLRHMFSYDRFVFFNSGDRSPSNTNIDEDLACERLGIEKKFLPLPKVYSSSALKGV